MKLLLHLKRPYLNRWNHATVDSKYAVTTEIYEAMIGGRMSKKIRSQGDRMLLGAHLVEKCRRAIETERINISKNPSVTRGSEYPSASISSTGIKAENRLKTVIMNRNKRRKLFFFSISTGAGSIGMRSPLKVNDFLLCNSTNRCNLSSAILKNHKSNQNSEIAFKAGNR